MPSLLCYPLPHSCLPILVNQILYQIKLRLGIGPHTRFPLKNTWESVICGNCARIEQAIDCGVYIAIMLLTFLTHLTVRPANYLCRTKECLMMSVRILGSAAPPHLQHQASSLQALAPVYHLTESCPPELQTSASSSCVWFTSQFIVLSRTFHLQVAIIFPPAAAFFIAGCGCDLLINICLTM